MIVNLWHFVECKKNECRKLYNVILKNTVVLFRSYTTMILLAAQSADAKTYTSEETSI